MDESENRQLAAFVGILTELISISVNDQATQNLRDAKDDIERIIVNDLPDLNDKEKVTAVQTGQHSGKIAAIKMYRERVHCTLKAAKIKVEEYLYEQQPTEKQTGNSIPFPSLTPEEQEIARDSMIQGIKAYRQRTGSNLKHAKDVVENFLNSL